MPVHWVFSAISLNPAVSHYVAVPAAQCKQHVDEDKLKAVMSAAE